jgi:DNA polymerase III epsilon subunit family exonuclease
MPIRAAIDIETTGFAKGSDEIIELAILPFNEQYTIIGKFHTFIKPLRGLGFAAQKVNGITEEMLIGAPTPLQVRSAFLDWKENILGEGKIELLGHNVCGFDRPFLDYFFSLDKANEIFSHRADDTMVLARGMKGAGLLKVEHTGLSDLCNYFHIVREKDHRAYDDAAAALKVWLALLKILQKCK